MNEKVYTEAEVQDLIKKATIKEPKLMSVVIHAVYDDGHTETASAYHPSGLFIQINNMDEVEAASQGTEQVKTSD